MVFLIDALLYFYHRNEDLKQMLESSKDSAKLDAMKRIVGVCEFFLLLFLFVRGYGSFGLFFLLDGIMLSFYTFFTRLALKSLNNL